MNPGNSDTATPPNINATQNTTDSDMRFRAIMAQMQARHEASNHQDRLAQAAFIAEMQAQHEQQNRQNEEHEEHTASQLAQSQFRYEQASHRSHLRQFSEMYNLIRNETHGLPSQHHDQIEAMRFFASATE